MINQWECGVCVFEHRRRLAQIPRSDNDKIGLCRTYRFRVCAATQPGQLTPTMGNAQDQALGTENLRQNQVLFRKYTAVDGALKKKITTAVEPVFLSPMVDHLTEFGQVSALNMLQNLFSSYGTIEEIDLYENAIKMIGPYDPAENMVRLIETLEKGRQFARAVRNNIAETMMVSIGITLLAQTAIFNDNIRE